MIAADDLIVIGANASRALTVSTLQQGTRIISSRRPPDTAVHGRAFAITGPSTLTDAPFPVEPKR